ncbi:MAG: glycosyltransferase family 2 protein [Clostridia bacterium]|nr:glycosyltransferase family 2 protein [Clostridia bacterium]
MEKKKTSISFVIPCFNEEKNVSLFYDKVAETFQADLSGLELIFVDDGSSDKTCDNLRELYEKHKDHIKVVSFSRNFGKESAMLAGLEKAIGEYTVIIDADLQQNPKYVLIMRDFLDEHKEYDIVCCVQEERKEGFVSKFLKKSFYHIMNNLMEVDVKDATSDFRLMRRNVVDSILSLKESNRFSKGIFAWVGFNTFYMPYVVEERAAGTSKWGIKKLFKYAFQGIVSFSDAPLVFSLKLGVFFLVASIFLFIVRFI